MTQTKIKIHDCHFKNNTTDSSSIGISSPVGSLTEGVIVSNNTFEDVDIGVISWGVKDLTVIGNRMKNVASEFVGIWGDAFGGTTFEENSNVVISGNDLTNLTLGNSIVLRKCDTVSVTGNSIKTAVRRIIAFDNYAKNVSITGNTISNFASAATQGAIDRINDTTTLDNINISGNVISSDNPITSIGVNLDYAGVKNNVTISNNQFIDVIRGVRINAVTRFISNNNIFDYASND